MNRSPVTDEFARELTLVHVCWGDGQDACRALLAEVLYRDTERQLHSHAVVVQRQVIGLVLECEGQPTAHHDILRRCPEVEHRRLLRPPVRAPCGTRVERLPLGGKRFDRKRKDPSRTVS